MNNSLALTNALMEIAGGSCANAIAYTFRRMDIAEDEIREAKTYYPELAQRIDRAFRHLCPTPPLANVGDTLYRHHCSEIIDRIIHRCDVKPGTRAEIIGALSGASLKSPLDRTACLLYEKLFAELFPAKARAFQIDHSRIDEFEQSEMNALRIELARKLSCAREP